MCPAGGEVVSVRCCSGGLNYYPHRLHLTLSVSSVTHIHETRDRVEMRGVGAVQVVCANVGAVG